MQNKYFHQLKSQKCEQRQFKWHGCIYTKKINLSLIRNFNILTINPAIIKIRLNNDYDVCVNRGIMFDACNCQWPPNYDQFRTTFLLQHCDCRTLLQALHVCLTTCKYDKYASMKRRKSMNKWYFIMRLFVITRRKNITK